MEWKMNRTLARRLYLLIGVAAVSLAAIVVLLLVGAKRPAPQPESSAAAVYILGEWEGKLAVFLPGKENPSQIYEVYITTLPPAEQERLQAGVPVGSEEELGRLLEDYTS